MGNAITQKDLEAVVARLNRMTGQPLAPYIKKGDKLIAAIGNYHLDWAYGGVKLVQMMGEGGGIRCVSQSGYTTKRGLFNEMHTLITGLLIQQEERDAS